MKKYLSVLMVLLVIVGILVVPCSASAKGKKPEKIYNNKSLVYVQKTVKYKNFKGKSTKFYVPGFNIKTKQAKLQNKQIENDIMLKYRSVKIKSKNNRLAFKETYCKYNDNQYSYIVVKFFNKDNSYETKSYCIDTTDGTKVTKQQVMAINGYTFKELKKELKLVFFAKYSETSEAGAITNRAFVAKLKMENLEIYVNSKGKLCVDIKNFKGTSITLRVKKRVDCISY